MGEGPFKTSWQGLVSQQRISAHQMLTNHLKLLSAKTIDLIVGISSPFTYGLSMDSIPYSDPIELGFTRSLT
jgi:hypothetical protein